MRTPYENGIRIFALTFLLYLTAAGGFALEGKAVGAFGNSRVALVCADLDRFKRAEMLAVQIVLAVCNITSDGRILGHRFQPLFLFFAHIIRPSELKSYYSHTLV